MISIGLSPVAAGIVLAVLLVIFLAVLLLCLPLEDHPAWPDQLAPGERPTVPIPVTRPTRFEFPWRPAGRHSINRRDHRGTVHAGQGR